MVLTEPTHHRDGHFIVSSTTAVNCSRHVVV